jgi:hypothetical protein
MNNRRGSTTDDITTAPESGTERNPALASKTRPESGGSENNARQKEDEEQQYRRPKKRSTARSK